MKIWRNPEEIPKPTKFLNWLKFIQHYMNHMVKEHHYWSIAINRKMDLFQQINYMEGNEFILACIQSTDNSRDHAICISKKFIYDSNYEYAISFSKDALNACCPPGFQFIFNGYYFHQRNTKLHVILKNENEINSILNL